MSWTTDLDFEDLVSVGGGGGSSSRNTSRYSGYGPGQAGTGKTTIAELSLGIAGTELVGVIIAKEDPRSFPNKKEPGTERHLLSFTLRDSPTDFINVTCWGSRAYTQHLADQLHLGHVVELNQFIVQSKPTDGSDERFRPSSPSPYQLSLSENRSTVAPYGGSDVTAFADLTHVPGKPSNDYYTISDVITNGRQLSGQTVNLLAVVRSVGRIREITTKLGKHLRHCEVKLLDETMPTFTLNLWSEELISMAQTWTPKDNVIFAADVRVTFDDYKKTMVATANSKTIITVNPDTREAHALYQYAQTVHLDDTGADHYGEGAGDNIDVSTIETVYTVQQVKAKQSQVTAAGGSEYGLLYAYVSKFNVDGDAPVSLTRCGKCGRRVGRASGGCEREDCPVGSGQQQAGPTTTQYHVQVDLSDHTATLPACLLAPDAASTMLGGPVSEFEGYDENKKTQLKWEYLLEMCKVYIKMSLPTYERRRPGVRVLACGRADLQEAVKFLQ